MKEIALKFDGFRHTPLVFNFQDSIDKDVVKGQLSLLADTLIQENWLSLLGIEDKFLNTYGETITLKDLSLFDEEYEDEENVGSMIYLENIYRFDYSRHADLIALDTAKLENLMYQNDTLGIFDLLEQDTVAYSDLFFYQLEEDLTYIPKDLIYDTESMTGSCVISFKEEEIKVSNISKVDYFEIESDDEKIKEKILYSLKKYNIFSMISNMAWTQKSLERAILMTKEALNGDINPTNYQELTERLMKLQFEYKEAISTAFKAYSLIHKDFSRD